jgi:hypothetical protein
VEGSCTAQDEPNKPRPYKIPMSDTGVFYFCVFPTLLCVLVICVADVSTHMIGFTGLTIAFIAFRISVYLKGGDASKLIDFDVLDE